MHLKRMIHRSVAGVLVLAFLMSDVRAYAQGVVQLPLPGTRIALSPVFAPSLLKGIKVYRNDPFRFDFILDKGDDRSPDEQVKVDSTRLIKYFLAALTIPENDLWVNLSPYEKDRIVPDAFGQTEMGRDLLAQDYLLKQITASLMYPEDGLGKKFWEEVYRQAREKFGTTDIPVDTFNKVWIMPAKAVVYEKPRASGEQHPESAVGYVVDSHLKVMLESDYRAGAQNEEVVRRGEVPAYRQAGVTRPLETASRELAKHVIRDVIIPVLEKEVNEGKNFAPLRQVYNSLILAAWYKKKVLGAMRDAPFGSYVDRNKILGVNIDDPKEAESIWGRYVEAFKKGAYSFIREEYDPVAQETIPRKYFAGGMSMKIDLAMAPTIDASQLALQRPLQVVRAEVEDVPAEGVPVNMTIPDKKPIDRVEITGLDELKGIDPRNPFFVTKLMQVRVGGKYIFTQPTTRSKTVKYKNISYGKARSLAILLSLRNRKGEALFNVDQALRVPFISDDAGIKDVVNMIGYLMRWESHGWQLNDSLIRSCLERRRYFHKEAFEELWERFTHFGFSPRMVLQYLLSPFYVKKSILDWSIKPASQWPVVAKLLRWRLIYLVKADVPDIAFFLDKVAGAEAGMFKKKVEEFIAQDKKDLEYLRQNGPEGQDAKLKSLAISFSADIRRQFLNLLFEWLPEYFVNRDFPYDNDAKEAAYAYLEHYKWYRSNAGLSNLKNNVRFVCLHYKWYLAFRRLAPHVKTIMATIYQERKVKVPEMDIVAHLRDKGYLLRDIQIAQSFYFRSLDKKFSGGEGSLLDVIVADGMDPLEELIDKEEDEVGPAEVAIKVAGYSDVLRGTSLADVLGRFLIEPGRESLAGMIKSKKFTARLNEKEIKLPQSLRLVLVPGKHYDLAIDAAQNSIVTVKIPEGLTIAPENGSGMEDARDFLQRLGQAGRESFFEGQLPRMRFQGEVVWDPQAAGRLAVRKDRYARVLVLMELLNYRNNEGQPLFDLLRARVLANSLERSNRMQLPGQVAWFLGQTVFDERQFYTLLARSWLERARVLIDDLSREGYRLSRLDGIRLMAYMSNQGAFGNDPWEGIKEKFKSNEMLTSFPQGLAVDAGDDGKPVDVGEYLKGLEEVQEGVLLKELRRVKFRGQALDHDAWAKIAREPDRYARVLFVIALMRFQDENGRLLFTLEQIMSLAGLPGLNVREQALWRINWLLKQGIFDSNDIYYVIKNTIFLKIELLMAGLRQAGPEVPGLDGKMLIKHAMIPGRIDAERIKRIRTELETTEALVAGIPRWISIGPATGSEKVDIADFLRNLKEIDDEEVFVRQLARLRSQGVPVGPVAAKEIARSGDRYAQALFVVELLTYANVQGRPLFVPEQAVTIAGSSGPRGRSQVRSRLQWLMEQDIFDGSDISRILKYRLVVKIRFMIDQLTQSGREAPVLAGKILLKYAVMRVSKDGAWLNNLRAELEKKEVPVKMAPEGVTVVPDAGGGKVDVPGFMKQLQKTDDKNEFARQLQRISFHGTSMKQKAAEEISREDDRYARAVFLIELWAYRDKAGRPLFSFIQALTLARRYGANFRRWAPARTGWLAAQGLFDGNDIYRIFRGRLYKRIRSLVDALKNGGQTWVDVEGKVLIKYAADRQLTDQECLQRVRKELAAQKDPVAQVPEWVSVEPQADGEAVDIQAFLQGLKKIKDEEAFAGQLLRISLQGIPLRPDIAKEIAHKPDRYERTLSLIELSGYSDKQGAPLLGYDQVVALAKLGGVNLRANVFPNIPWLMAKGIFDGDDIYYVVTESLLAKIQDFVQLLVSEGWQPPFDGKVLIKYARKPYAGSKNWLNLSAMKKELAERKISPRARSGDRPVKTVKAFKTSEGIKMPVVRSVQKAVAAYPSPVMTAGVEPVIISPDNGVPRDFLKELAKTSGDEQAFAWQLARMECGGKRVIEARGVESILSSPDRYARVVFLVELLRYKGKEGQPLFDIPRAATLARLLGRYRRGKVADQVSWFLDQKDIDATKFFNLVQLGTIEQVMALIESLKTEKRKMSPYAYKQLLQYRKFFSSTVRNASKKTTITLTNKDIALLLGQRLAIAAGEDGSLMDVLGFLKTLIPDSWDKDIFFRLLLRMRWDGKEMLDEKAARAIAEADDRYERVIFMLQLLTYENSAGQAIFTPYRAATLADKYGATFRERIPGYIEWFQGQQIFDDAKFYTLLSYVGRMERAQDLVRQLQAEGYKLSSVASPVLMRYAVRSDLRTADRLNNAKQDLDNNARPVGPTSRVKRLDRRKRVVVQPVKFPPAKFSALAVPADLEAVAIAPDSGLPQIDILRQLGIFDTDDISRILAENVFEKVQWLIQKLKTEDAWKLEELDGKVLVQYAIQSWNNPEAVFAQVAMVLWNKKRKALVGKGKIKDPDPAASAPGGIDLAPGMRTVEARDDGQRTAFQFDPVAVHRLDGARGIRPVIIGMAPLEDVAGFLGLPSVRPGR